MYGLHHVCFVWVHVIVLRAVVVIIYGFMNISGYCLHNRAWGLMHMPKIGHFHGCIYYAPTTTPMSLRAPPLQAYDLFDSLV